MRPAPRLVLSLLLVLASGLVLAACGGGGKKSADRGYSGRGYDRGYKGPISGTKGFALKPSLVANGFSPSGLQTLSPSYQPTGKIVGDSGFRPQVDGFSFENYGNDGRPRNLGVAEMVDLFGRAVCIPGGSSSSCQLTPVARVWMENTNNAMAGGHCEGLSMTALRMFSGSLKASDFGAATPPQLSIRGNPALQSNLAETWAYQALPSVIENRLSGSPVAIAKFLAKALNEGNELYTLGIFKPDGTGGHAITPFAVEAKAGGDYAILVYDNNFPGATRAIQIDGQTDTWRFRGGVNPADPSELYVGNRQTRTLSLDPLSPALGVQACPFCKSGNAASDDTGKRGALVEYAELALQGDPNNHPHLVFTDDQGRRTGVIRGKLVKEIPDVQVVGVAQTKTWASAPEPRYRMPEGRNYSITVDGTDLDRRARPKINLITNGLVIEVGDITIDPGQKDEMALPKGYGLTYQANGKKGEEPNIFAGLVSNGASYQFAASAVGVKPGSIISLVVDQPDNVAYVDSTGGKGQLDEGSAVYILQLTKVTADGKSSIWQRNDVVLNGDKREKAGFEYSKTAVPGKPLPFVLLNGDNSVKKVVLGKPVKAA